MPLTLYIMYPDNKPIFTIGYHIFSERDIIGYSKPGITGVQKAIPDQHVQLC